MNVNIAIHECVRVELEGTVACIWFATPARSVNVLDAGMLAGFDKALDWLEEQISLGHVGYVVLRSENPNSFFVGADVRSIAELQTREAVEAVLDFGQNLFDRIERLSVPTLAAVSGPCLGGGLELALACDHIVALRDSRTRFALPEIRLGLIPGWGGTQRLPRKVGLQKSLKMILTGSGLDVEAAERCSLISLSLPQDDWHAFFENDTLARFLDQSSLTRPELADARRGGILNWLLEKNRWGQKWLLRLASRKAAAQSRHYPALQEALRAVRAGLFAGRNSRSGFESEKQGFVRLRFSATAQNLISIFLDRDQAKRPASWLEKAAIPQSSAQVDQAPCVAVIGAGVMGAGIGTLVANKGGQVVFREASRDAVEAARARVVALLDEQATRGKLSNSQKQAALSRMDFTTDWHAIRACDLAIEAVVEVDAVKREVMQMLDRNLKPEALICSNTSSFSVSDLSSQVGRKSQVAGLHFFNPVHRMELVEVVRTERLSDRSLSRLLGFVKWIGKTPLVTSDKPGFLVNRVLFPYLAEAIRMIAEGHNATDIDRQLRHFGMPMGPLELIDQVGVDIAQHVANSLKGTLLDEDVPCSFLADMVDRGWLGKKAGVGFYIYDRSEILLENTGLHQQASPRLAATGLQVDSLNDIQRRLIYPMLNEAVHCLDEFVVTEPWMVDLGMVLGTGFAPHTGGPIRLIDSIGSQAILHNLQTMQRHFGARFQPADGFQRVLNQAEPFFAKDRRLLTWENDHEHRYAFEPRVSQ